ncbi:hypothetical protein [Nostoc sp. DSM 114167]|jgi:hypothetical protein|uniref:hypothetical protein n=1 Tax=Nostoc sp. DSM 114167 TaxID=3439050 RepID=UPI0040466682
MHFSWDRDCDRTNRHILGQLLKLKYINNFGLNAMHRAQQEAQRADIAEQRVRQLAEQLRALGIDPDNLA